MRVLNTDVTVSKKAQVGAELTFASLTEEIEHRGASLITAAVADAFGVPEIRAVAVEIDKVRMELFEQNPHFMIKPSTVIPGQIYRYGKGTLTIHRLWSCGMHAMQNIFKPLLEKVVQVQGLKHNASPMQNMYILAYYNDKFRTALQVLNEVSCDGNADAVKDMPADAGQGLRDAVDVCC